MRRKRNIFNLRRIFSMFIALILCMTVPIYAAEAEYNFLDGSSPDKPSNYSDFAYYEGYNAGGGYELEKMYVADYLKDYSCSLYMPNYSQEKEALTYVFSKKESVLLPSEYTNKGVVLDKIVLSDDVETNKIVTYDVLCSAVGISPFYGLSLGASKNGLALYEFANGVGGSFYFGLDIETFVDCNWSSTSFDDVIYKVESNEALSLWSTSQSYNRSSRDLRIYNVDYICLWDNSGFIHSFNKKPAYGVGEFSSKGIDKSDTLDKLDYSQYAWVAQSIFVSLISDGSIERCSDELLARLGVYRANKFDYDSDTNTCIPKSGSSIRYDLSVPKDINVVFDGKSELYEITWNNESVMSSYPNASMNLVVTFTGKTWQYNEYEGNPIFGTASSLYKQYKNIEVLNRVLPVTEKESFVNKANVHKGLRSKIGVEDNKILDTETEELHFLLRNYAYVQSTNIYHLSNWVDVKVTVTTNDSGDSVIEWTANEYKGSASSGDIIQSINGGNTGTNADVGNAGNVVKPDGDVTYDGTINTISGTVDNTNLLTSMKNGYGLLGGNGAFAMMSDTFGFLPKEIWIGVAAFVASGLVIALFKLVF